MSLQFNQLIIAGNLARDPELRVLAGNHSVCNFCIANNRRGKNAKGEPREEVTFVECQAWDKSADFVAGHFSKGEAIHVTGRIRQETWEKDGVKHSRLVCVVDHASFVESKPREVTPKGAP